MYRRTTTTTATITLKSLPIYSGAYGGGGFKNGNIASIDHSFTPPHHNIDRLNQYNYDSRNRLLTSFVETVSSYNEFLSYEENGRITQYKRGPTANPTIHDYTYWTNPEQSFDFNRVSFITGWNDQSPGNYTYDFSGNMTGDDEKDLSLTWDYKNQPVRADFTPEYLKFRYDAKDNRIKKEYYDGQDTEITRYLWSGSHPIVELYADGSMKNLNIYAGDNLIAHRSFIPGAICEGALNCFTDPDFHCIPENCEFVPGDVDGNGVGVELSDVIYLIAWNRGTGLPPPPPMSRGDVDCSGSVGLPDVTKIIACYNGTDTPDCCYYHCGMLYYHLNDHLGSTRVLTDSTGRMYAAYDYFATGDKTDLNWVYKGTNYQFTGKEYDEEAGFNMNYFGARYFDPKAFIFTSVEPLVTGPFVAGHAEGIRYGLYLSTPYTYSHNNPIRYIDAYGDDTMGFLSRLSTLSEDLQASHARYYRAKQRHLEVTNVVPGTAQEKEAARIELKEAAEGLYEPAWETLYEGAEMIYLDLLFPSLTPNTSQGAKTKKVVKKVLKKIVETEKKKDPPPPDPPPPPPDPE